MAGNLVLVGTGLFLIVFLVFFFLRRVNRPMIVVVSGCFFLYAAASALTVTNALTIGTAPWPKSRYDLAVVAVGQAPAAYWLSCMFLAALCLGLGFVGVRFLAIAFRSGRYGP